MTKLLLLFASCSLLWVCCGQTNAQGKRLEPDMGKLPDKAVGISDTEEGAKAAAFVVAARMVNDLMAMQKPPMDNFQVDKDYVRKHLVETGYGGEEKDLLGGAPQRTWTLPFRTDIDWWGEVVRKNREARAEERHTWTARGMLGLTVLLLAVVGYIRLDEYTQRRYTGWLRLAGVGLATSAAVGLWYVMHAG